MSKKNIRVANQFVKQAAHSLTKKGAMHPDMKMSPASLTDAELDALMGTLNKVGGCRDRIIVVLSLNSGLRLSELTALTRDSIAL